MSNFENLALACVSCSLHKAAKLTAEDPDSGMHIPIYNPRGSNWFLHFEWKDGVVKGLTTVGRATVLALRMNRPSFIEIRVEEAYRGRHPQK